MCSCRGRACPARGGETKRIWSHECLRAIPSVRAHTGAGRIYNRQEHFIAALMVGRAAFTKPPLVLPRAYGADLRRRRATAFAAGDLRRVISRQQLDGATMRTPIPKGHYFQIELGCRSKVILVEKHHSWLEEAAESRLHSRFPKVLHAAGTISPSFNRKAAQMATTFQPDVAQKSIHPAQRSL